jgi:hypothetical protein
MARGFGFIFANRPSKRPDTVVSSSAFISRALQ